MSEENRNKIIKLQKEDRVFHVEYKKGDMIVFNFKNTIPAKLKDQLEEVFSKQTDCKIYAVCEVELDSIGVFSEDKEDDEGTPPIQTVDIVGGKKIEVRRKE